MKRDRIVGAGVSLLAAAAAVWAFAPVLAGGVLTRMDDDVYMAMAQKFGGLTPAGVGWALTETEPYYHPLPRLTHLLAYSLFGFWMAGHHAVNLVLHAGNAALVAALAWVLFAAWPVGQRAAAAGVAGVVFAVHPLQAESVAWLAGRTQLVCGTLMLGCALAYVRVAGGRGRWRWLPGALFALGWLAKPIVVTMPLVLLVLDWFPLGRYRAVGWKTLLGEKAWMFALGGVLTVWTFRFAPEQLVYTTADLDVWQRGLLAARASVFYLWKLVWPAWLSPFYPLVGEIRLAMPEFFVSVGVVAMMCAGAWWARRRCAVWTAAWLAYVALLLPVSGVTQFGIQSVANRHAYVAVVPLLLAGGAAVGWVLARAPVAGRVALAAAVLAGAAQLGVRARKTARMWHDDQTFWLHVLSHYPDYLPAMWKIVWVATLRQDYSVALPVVEEIRRRRPGDLELQSLAGFLYLKTGRYPAAVATLEPLARTNLWMPAARYNLAGAYARLGSNEAAVAVLKELVARQPEYADYAQRDREFFSIRELPEFVETVRGRPPS